MKMETHLQQELAKLKEQLLKMGGLAERAISDAAEALVKRDTPVAQKTIGEDEKINKTELVIDDWCLKLLALHQPLAADLRFITSAMRINVELERIGDLAVNIAERVVSLNQEPQLKPYIDLPRMAERPELVKRRGPLLFISGGLSFYGKRGKNLNLGSIRVA
jgi:phosphate transport system protein